jgi:osmotically-inducible protein OsmY
MDEQNTGGYRGRGPKGYHRSVDRIREDVCDRLSDDDWLDASEIDVQMQGEEVILTGTVNSREDKRRAEDLAESIPGVRNVENRLRVGRGEDAFGSNKMNTGSTSKNTGTTGTERGRNK